MALSATPACSAGFCAAAGRCTSGRFGRDVIRVDTVCTSAAAVIATTSSTSEKSNRRCSLRRAVFCDRYGAGQNRLQSLPLAAWHTESWAVPGFTRGGPKKNRFLVVWADCSRRQLMTLKITPARWDLRHLFNLPLRVVGQQPPAPTRLLGPAPNFTGNTTTL